MVREITPVSSEYFATSADAHLVLGHITPGQYSCDTPDNKEKTTLAALRRLARVVCADLDEIGTDGAYQVAGQFWEKQRNVVCGQVRRMVAQSGAHQVVAGGIGAPLFASELDGTDLTSVMGSHSDALPAFAVREIALQENRGKDA